MILLVPDHCHNRGEEAADHSIKLGRGWIAREWAHSKQSAEACHRGSRLPDSVCDQPLQVGRQSRPAAWSRFPTPEQLETVSMPSDECVRLDDDQQATPCNQPRQHDERNPRRCQHGAASPAARRTTPAAFSETDSRRRAGSAIVPRLTRAVASHRRYTEPFGPRRGIGIEPRGARSSAKHDRWVRLATPTRSGRSRKHR
jgi:hypothetical protein